VGNLAENYERYFVPAIFHPWAIDLVDTADPQAGERVLDVACGTGVVSRVAGGRVGTSGKVVGLDINPAMLAVAGSVGPEGSAIEWKTGSADSLPFPDQSFDLVLCQQGLQFFPDKTAALAEMKRVLVPGGRVALSVWRDIRHIPGYAAFADAIEAHLTPEPANFIRLTGALGDEALLRDLLDEAEFHDLEVRLATKEIRFASAEDFAWQWVQTTPLAWMQVVNQADDSIRAAVVASLQAKLGEYGDEDGLAFPIEAYVATGSK
jgi:SAM-dependent methyltransferase